ncbi:hypothetical protein A6V39_00415 [Candidatus Mycoplasma haematobovis]|uniref:Uncharacterized protein n=1 Tax=Candidatus Mycoplasma haematobovis TaxID=432608 RepID=A0A1A9QDH1_9MOLU|nr:hypothetical protein [Candidatus Mycoplasma haematobovis]OAL10513.1 hypothetical protein A6V39_00415 [Candidatus Mycoplasma haematobovis]
MTPKTIIASIAGTGALGGVITGGYFFMQPKNLKDILLKEGGKPLSVTDKSNDDIWTKLVKKYTEMDDTNPSIKIKELTLKGNKSKQEAGDIELLKKHCKTLYETPISSGDTFETNKKHTLNWCNEKSEMLKDMVAQASG